MVRVVFKHTAKNLTSVQISEKVGLGASTVRQLRSGRLPLNSACFTVWQKTFGTKSPGDSVNNCFKPPSSAPTGLKVTSYQTPYPVPATAPISRSAKKLASKVSTTPEAVPSTPTQIETEKEEPMLLPKQTLSAEARKRFALPFANPFDGEVTRDEDMFVNGEIRFVRESAWQAAIGGRFVAIVGESGAGKTTMLEDLKEQILKEHKPLVFIEPSVLGMEDSDTKGKSIKSAGIQTAIVMTLNPSEGVAQSDEKRARQVKRMLEESTTAGHSHLLVIEEAHSLPIPTLKHLKRLHERMRLGRRPMLGILLLGHPELEGKLNRFDVREVMQRCEVARLCPLGDDLLAYLTFRAASVGRKLDEFITPDGVAELAKRLTINAGANSKQVSLLYPLNVNNWMVAALNTAAGFGAPRVDRDIVLAV
jgi:type II secretory pathway predicted ATPase ExeA